MNRQQPSQAIKSLAKRHDLSLARDVPVDESVISTDSILTHSGAVDTWLAHGLVHSLDLSVCLRRLRLRPDPGQAKTEDLAIFVVSIPHPGPDAFLLAHPAGLPQSFSRLLGHTMKLDLYQPGGGHKLYSPTPLNPGQQELAGRLADSLAQSLNLEITPLEINLFTASPIDRPDLAEHLLRTAVAISQRL